MSRKSRKDGKNKHHVYPRKDTRHNYEIKMVKIKDHQRYHNLVGDRTPKQAVRFIAKNFMPTELEHILLEAIR